MRDGRPAEPTLGSVKPAVPLVLAYTLYRVYSLIQVTNAECGFYFQGIAILDSFLLSNTRPAIQK